MTGKTDPRRKSCPYNTGVIGDCEGPACERCGWNPIVAEQRRKALREENKREETK